jgi:hypothetical protein
MLFQSYSHCDPERSEGEAIQGLQSRSPLLPLDCRVAYAPRNDWKKRSDVYSLTFYNL